MLEISYLSDRAGWIEREQSGLIRFTFDPEFIRGERPPVLSQSFLSEEGKPVERPRGYPGQTPPFFSNLLPEGVLRSYCAQAGKVSEGDELGLSRVLGRDLPGAVTAIAVSQPRSGASGAAAGGVRFTRPLRESAQAPSGAWRFSLSGVQFKLSAILTKDERSGERFTVPARGIGGDWIVKFPSSQHERIAENEWVLMTLADRIGIPVPETRLIPLADIGGIPDRMQGNGGPGAKNAFVIRRFDRLPGGGKIHMEDFCQVFGVFPLQKYERYSYAGIARTLKAKCGGEAATDFTRRVAFSSLTGNGDMHLKNVSLLYEDPARPTLSPAYDLLCTRSYVPGDRLALGFGGSKEMEGLPPARIRRYARSAGLDTDAITALIRDTAEQTVEEWRQLPERDLLPKSMDRQIDRHLEESAQRTLREPAAVRPPPAESAPAAPDASP